MFMSFMTCGVDTPRLPKQTFTFGSFFNSPKRWCYDSDWGIRHAPGCVTCDHHLRHIPGVADVDESYKCALHKREAAFEERYSEGYRAGCIAQRAHDKERLKSYRSQLKAAQTQIALYEVKLDRFEKSTKQLKDALDVFKIVCNEHETPSSREGDFDCTIPDCDCDDEDNHDSNYEDEDEDEDEDKNEEDEDGNEGIANKYDDQSRKEEEDDYDRVGGSFSAEANTRDNVDPRPTAIALKDIRRKMLMVHLPGQRRVFLEIKRLVSEAHRTSCWQRTDVQNVLLSEWRRPSPNPHPTFGVYWNMEEIYVYVDASKVGIGFYSEGLWQAWRLKEGWKQAKIRDVQWAEAVAVEMDVRFLLENLGTRYKGQKIWLYSDNEQVVDAILALDFDRAQVGPIVRNYYDFCCTHRLDCTIEWVRGSGNPADAPSRLSSLDEHLRYCRDVTIPLHLQKFILPYHLST